MPLQKRASYMETATEQAQAAQEHPATASAGNPTQDDITTAIMTGETPIEIQRLETAVSTPRVAATPVVEPKNEQTETVVEEVPAEETTVEETTTEEQPAGETPQVTPVEEHTPERIRLSHLSPKDRELQLAIHSLTKSGMSLEDATNRVMARPVEQASQEQQLTEAQQLEVQHGAIQDEMKILEESGEQPSVELINRLVDIKADLKIAKERERTAAHEAEVANRQSLQTQAQTVEQRALTKAVELYPQIADENSALWKEANRIATDPTHPDYDASYRTNPSAALAVSKIAATNLGILPAKAAPKPASPSVSQPGPTAKPAAASKSTTPLPPKPSAQEIRKASEESTLAAIEGDMDHVQTRPMSSGRGYMILR